MCIRDRVPIDPLLLYQRISLNKQFDEHLRDYLQYEMSPYRMALFDDAGIRKNTKSKIYDLFEPITAEFHGANIKYVIDGGFILRRVVWQRGDTFGCVLPRLSLIHI